MRLRHVSAAIVTALLSALLVAVPAQGANVEVTLDNITYRANDTDVAAGATIISAGAVGPNLVLPSSVTIGGVTYAVKQIGGYVFQSKGLTSVTLPPSVIYVQPYAFASNALTHVTVPSNVTLLNTGAFYDNDLTSVTLHEGLLNIGPGAFNSNQLTSVDIPSTVYTVGGSAFLANPALTSITFNGNAPLLNSPSPLGLSSVVVRHYADATGFTSPTWNGGGTTAYPTQVIPNAVVTFDANGHGTAPSAVSVRPGAAVADPGDLSATGYTFDGWFTAPSGGTQVTFPYTATSTVTLHARWTLNTHTVTFELGNGDSALTDSANHGTTVAAPAQPTRTGHTFTGWFTAAEGGTQVTFPYLVTADVTFYAQFAPNSYTVTLDDQYSPSPLTISVITYGDEFEADPITRPGHTFLGWFTAPVEGSVAVFPHAVTGDVTFYAQWAVNSYTVTFEPGNGDAATTASAEYDATIEAPAAPTRANFAFAGWFTAAEGGTAIEFPFNLTDDVTVYAQWIAAPAGFTAPAQATAGDVITITGDGYLPGEAIEIWLLSTPVLLASVQADADGTFTAQVTIASGTAPGAHHLEVRGELSGTLSSDLTVLEALSDTGANVTGALWLAVALLLTGTALIAGRSRRVAS